MTHEKRTSLTERSFICRSIPETSDSSILVHVPEPIGWMALTAAEVLSAQARAVDLLPVVSDGNDSDAVQALLGPRLLSADDAAGVLSVDPSWLLKQAREGRIPCVRLGKYVRFDPAAIVGHCTKAAERRP